MKLFIALMFPLFNQLNSLYSPEVELEVIQNPFVHILKGEIILLLNYVAVDYPLVYDKHQISKVGF